MLYPGDWNGGYYAVQQSITLVAIYVECPHANFGEWTVVTEPTYTEEGLQERTCLDCGYVESEAIPVLTKDYTIRLFLDEADVELGAKIDGVDGTELLIPINMNEDYNDAYGDFPTASLVGYIFQGWFLEAYGFMMTEGEWNGGSYAVPGDCELYAIFEECPHANMSEWTVTVEPQVGVAGEQTATCLDCGYVAVEEIPALDPPAKAYTITFDPDGGVMPEGALLVLPIDYMDNYKEAAGYDYPVPTLDGYVFAGWYWELYNFTLTEGDWNGGYYAVQMSIDVVALYEEAPAPAEVEAAADGNTITVTNINDGVKDIFVAAGEQSAYADVKANMLYHLYATSHKIVDGTWSYDVSENGIYTVLVRYNDGTVEAKYFVVDCNDGKEPTMVQDGATVTFTNLNDLYVLRYVEGEYDTSYAIKRAPGVTNIKSWNLEADNSFSVTLEPGTYSFVTQFNDGNYVYYTITVEAPKKDYKITFDPDGGVMPEGVALEYGINYNENYKEATGIEYPVPTMDGYIFDGWYWEAFNYWLTEGDWNSGWFAVQQDVDLIALWLEA